MNGYQPQGQFPGQFGNESQPQGGGNQQSPSGGVPPYFTSSPKAQVPETKKSKWWIWFLVAILVLVGVVGGLISYLVRTPQYSLYKMYQAVLNKDYESFSKYFNIDSVLDDIFEKAIQQEKEKYSSIYSKEQLSQFETAAKSQFGPYKEMAKKEIKKEIEQGKFSLTEGYKISLVKVFGKIKTKRLSNGDVNVTLKDEKGREVTFTMRKKDGYWEIYKIDMTLKEMMKFIE